MSKITIDMLRRRSLLALAGLAGAAGPAVAKTVPSAATPNPQKDPDMGKHAVEIPKNNPVYGTSIAAFDKYGYSPAVRAGGLLFIAGAVGVRPDGTVPDSVAEQAELAFQRTAEILKLEGLTMADLVEVVSYHVDIANNLPAFEAAKNRYFEQPFPTWTILGVEALARPVLKVEIRSVAALRQ